MSQDQPAPKTSVYLGLGSNLGNRLGNLRSALAALKELPGFAIGKMSSIYETVPVDNMDQPKFLNMVVEAATDLTPAELLTSLLRIESHLGRVRQKTWEPRAIDLDILYYGDQIVSEDNLSIPHPRAAQRAFVLVPLCEIAPDFTDPLSRQKARELLAGLDRRGQAVVKIAGSKF